MEKVFFNKENQTLEAAGVSGYVLIVWDDETPKKWVFHHRFKMTFVFNDEQNLSLTSCQGSQQNAFVMLEYLASGSSGSLVTPNEHTDASSTMNSLQQANDGVSYSDSMRLRETVNTGASDSHLKYLRSNCGKGMPENLSRTRQKLSDHCATKEEIQGSSEEEADSDNGDSVFNEASSSEHSCKFCQSYFPNAKQLKAHMRDPSFQVECDHCKLPFPSRGDLFVHQLETYDIDVVKQHFPEFANIGKMDPPKHGGTFPCPVCATPTLIPNFKAHVLSQHFTELSYKCCMCGKAVTNDKSHFNHCRIHMKGRHKNLVKKRNVSKRNKSKNQQCKVEAERPVCEADVVRANVKNSVMVINPEKLSVEVMPQAEKTPSRRQRNTHETGKRYPCAHCGQTFSTPVKFNAHRKAPSLHLKCSFCDVILASRAMLLIHEQETHNLHAPANAPSLNNLESASATDSKEASAEKMGQNMVKSRQKVQCPVCSVEIIRSKLLYHVMRTHTREYPLSCCVCHLQFSHRAVLRSHYSKHSSGAGNEKNETVKKRRKPVKRRTTEGTFSCKSCSEVFRSKSEFHRHCAQHRTVCVFCNEDFQLVKLVEEHYEQVHSDQLLKCSFCGKKFPTQEKLQGHERYHRFAKPKPCHKCGAMVRCLKKHMQNAHCEPGSELTCLICAMKFKTLGAFESHQRNTHNDPDKQNSFNCPKCQKAFATRDRMSNHVKKMHMNRKSFQCEICGKRCTEKFNLRIHMRSHSNQTFLTCEMCGQGFKYKASLQGHMQSKHNVPLSGKFPSN